MTRRTLTTLSLAAMTALLSASVSLAQDPPQATPAGASADAALQVRANESFGKGDYASALPVFQKLEADLRNDPTGSDKLAAVQEQIRVCQRNLSGAKAATAAPTTAPSANADRKPHPAPKDGEVVDLTIKELGNFDYDPDQNTPIPADVKALSGHAIRLHGFMIPMDQAENISKFALVPSLFNCCYGQPPQVQHTIVVTCPKGKAVGYYPDEIVVEGTLKVDVMKDDGFIVGIFSVDTTSVKPAAK